MRTKEEVRQEGFDIWIQLIDTNCHCITPRMCTVYNWINVYLIRHPENSLLAVRWEPVARKDFLSMYRFLWILNTLSGCKNTAHVTSHQLLLVHSTLRLENWPPRIQQTTARLNGAPNVARRVSWFVMCKDTARDSIFPLCNSQLYRLARSCILVCC